MEHKPNEIFLKVSLTKDPDAADTHVQAKTDLDGLNPKRTLQEHETDKSIVFAPLRSFMYDKVAR